MKRERKTIGEYIIPAYTTYLEKNIAQYAKFFLTSSRQVWSTKGSVAFKRTGCVYTDRISFRDLNEL